MRNHVVQGTKSYTMLLQCFMTYGCIMFCLHRRKVCCSVSHSAPVRMQTPAHCDATVYKNALRFHVLPVLRPLQSCTAMGAHVQALQYLSKLCSHPLLVLDPANPVHVEAVEKATQLQASSPAAWKAIQPNLHQLQHAPKLEQLKQLLQVSCLHAFCHDSSHLLTLPRQTRICGCAIVTTVKLEEVATPIGNTKCRLCSAHQHNLPTGNTKCMLCSGQ